MPFDLFEISKCPVESLYGVQISLIYHMANSFYSFVANGWNVFGWKMLGEIRKGLKVFGWNEKTPIFLGAKVLYINSTLSVPHSLIVSITLFEHLFHLKSNHILQNISSTK